MSGTPDALGSSELLYLVGKDATGATARSVPFRINVYQEPTVSVSGGDVTVRVGARVTVTPSVSGLAGKATWELVTESGAAAPGLVLDPATGTFGGVPTGPGPAGSTSASATGRTIPPPTPLPSTSRSSRPSR